MKKVKVLGISKSKGRVSFTLEKKQLFIKPFRKFLENMGLDEWEFNGFWQEEDREGNKVDEKISGIIDEKQWFRTDKYDIDLIIGKSKIFLTVYSRKSDLQKSISKKIFEFCEFKE
jgi:hypothetical protein